MRRQGLLSSTGVVLRRDISPEGNISLLALLRGEGLLWLSLPGAARGKVRFGGAVEPLVWGEFNLYRGRKKVFLKEISVKRDFWGLRSDYKNLKTALIWSRVISSSSLSSLPMDEVIPVFYWSLDLLERGVDRDVMSLRFLWRLLRAWGVAPSLDQCPNCGSTIERASWRDGSFLCEKCSDFSNGRTFRLPLANWIVTSKKEDLLNREDFFNDVKELNVISSCLMKNINFLK